MVFPGFSWFFLVGGRGDQQFWRLGMIGINVCLGDICKR